MELKILSKKSMNTLGFNPSSSSESNKAYMPRIEFEINGIKGLFKDKTQWFKNDIEITWNSFEFIYYTNDNHCGGGCNEKRNTFPPEYNNVLELIIDELVKDQWNMGPDVLKRYLNR